MCPTPKMKLSYHNQSSQVKSMTKTKQDNDVIGHIGLVYAETKTEFSGPI